MENEKSTLLNYCETIDFSTKIESIETIDDFKKVGAIAWLFGIDLLSKNSIGTNNEKEQLTLALMRFKSLNVPAEIIFDVLKLRDKSAEEKEVIFGKLHQLSSEFSTLVDSNLPQDVIDIILPKIRYFLNFNSIVPVLLQNFLTETFITNDDSKLTYKNLLSLNSVIYDDISIEGSSIQYFIDLTNNQEYHDSLMKASEYFELQKYALIFKESIMMLLDKKEHSVLNHFEIFEDVIFNPIDFDINNEQQVTKLNERISTLYTNLLNIVNVNNEKVIEEVPVNESTPDTELENLNEEITQDFINKPKELFESIFDNINSQYKLVNAGQTLDYKNNVDDFIKLVDYILLDDETTSSLYMLMVQIRNWKNAKPQPTDSLLNNHITSIKSLLNFDLSKVDDKIKDLQSKYSTFIDKYIEEIPEDDKVKIIDIIKQMIEKIVFNSRTSIGILTSQIHDNVISTYKHLHQVLVEIEKQQIHGGMLSRYNILFNQFKNDYPSIIEMFEQSSELESKQVEIKFYVMLYQTLKGN